ncbi:MAG TPA: SDR family NAD(P)-dependent oxidoreductase [Roseiflexaceae bacterium]|nr:SDR family NAD(P)-dependent oxidoreductase [Roseiflexaceae bacterium]
MANPLEQLINSLAPEKRAILATMLQPPPEPIAIIGMGCRFPGGANTIEEFWDLLQGGRDAISEVPAERWDWRQFYDPDPRAPDKMHTRWGGFLSDIAGFDAAFFGIGPDEARSMDPQQRLLLEVVWEALEHAGLAADRLARSQTGVFVGIINDDYPHFLMDGLGRSVCLNSPYFGIGSSSSMAGGRLSYTLDFRGPNVSLDTACSSSLVATHLACQALRNRECDLALAGGVHAILLPDVFINLCKMNMLANDGRCKTFDAAANGFAMGEGCGIVVLRRLSDALKQGDPIVAVIRGTAVNEDGRSSSPTAPNGLAQQAVIRQALANAGVAPEQVQYVEAHGTGTPLGDPIELEALHTVLGAGRAAGQPLLVSAVKTNIGHLAAAAGVAGLIKTALALQHGQIPASLNLRTPNPAIPWHAYNLAVAARPTPWPERAGPRIAGVSSFGWSGTNAHAILEAAPERAAGGPSRREQLLLLSAKHPRALAEQSGRLGRALAARPDLDLADVAYTLQVGRSSFAHRRALVCRSREEAIALLADAAEAAPASHVPADRRPVAFVLGGAATQLAGLGRELFMEEPAFRAAVEQGCAALAPVLGRDLRGLLYPDTPGGAPLRPAHLAQAASAVLTYALALLWRSWGLRPQVLLGDRLGECVAACLSGVLSLEDALRLVVARARLVETLGLDEEAQHDAALPASAGGQIRALLASIALRPPQIASLSHVTGAAITPEQATDPGYWVRLFCEPDRFAEGAATLLAQPDLVLLEVGPGDALGARLRAHPACPPERAALVLASLPPAPSATAAALAAAGQLWQVGVSLDWDLFSAAEQRRRVALPGYPFQRRRFWVDPAGATPAEQPPAGKRAAVADWFHQPVWTPAALPDADSAGANWLVFADSQGVGRLIAERLRSAGQPAVLVEPGARLARLSDSHIVIDPDQPADYQALLKQAGTAAPLRILHLWSLDPPSGATGAERFRAAQRRGYASLLLLVQALDQALTGVAARVVVATDRMQAVEPQDIPAAEHATIPAVCLVINQEHTGLRCRSVDLRLAEDHAALAEHLIQEAQAPGGGTAVAYRGGQRLEQGLTPLPLEARPSRLRARGVYLLTGGLGGVGLTLAEHLARTVQARLALIGRGGLPPREQWDTWLAEHPAGDPTSRRIGGVRRLEEHGAEVLLLQADVAEPDQLGAAIAAAEARFGPLNGVLHAAGLTDQRGFASAKNLTPAQCEAHFRPKAYGLYALEQALGERPLDFCLLFSSLSAVLGGLGFGAYAPANAFMDAFAQRHSRSHTVPWTSVDWDAWRVQDDQAGRAGATLAQYEMLPDEGCAAFELVIAAGIPGRIIQATGDLEQRLRQWTPADTSQQAALGEGARPPVMSLHEYERRIAAIWSEVLGIEQVGLHDNFFDLGGNSLNGLQVVARLQQAFQIQLSNVALFEAPTVGALARLLRPPEPAAPATTPETRLQQRRAGARQTGAQDIAIIAMAGRFPGAAGVEQLWQNLCDGVEAISTLSEAELLAAGIDPLLIQNPQYVRAKPTLRDVDLFDPAFFGYTPREAELMDPQQRLFHECAWEALEQAGYDTQRYPGLVGVFAGANLNFYMLHMATDPLLVGAITDNVVLENDKDALATNISYRLNLRGPSFAVQTFCSTSLVAVHLACRSLLGGECDMALAGGVSVRVPVEGYLYKPGDQVSPDGRCRTFDAQAEGTIFGDGVGLVVLKRLDDALEDGDTVHAVIKSSAINNDGDLKVGYTAPSVVGQSEVITTALRSAALDPATIGYVEAHGTATKLGDPIEVAALTKAYRAFTDRRQFCAISSLKPNVGHLDRAAGVTGLIKAAMVLKRGLIPPLLHFREPNPEIDFASSPFFVPTALLPWPEQDAPRRAAVNSLGVGGTNAHVIVEQAPASPPSGPSRPWQVLLLSAKTPAALETAARNLRGFLQANPDTPLADVAYTLQVGRRVFEHRRVVVCRDREEACRLLESGDPARVFQRAQRPASRSVALLIGGMGEQYAGMGRELYEREPVFRSTVDRCCAILAPLLGQDLRALLYPDTPASPAAPATPDLRAMLGRGGAAPAGPLHQTALAHPALFVTCYALAELLRSWGMLPKALLGYSLGEYVAACLSGVFSLEDALRIVAARARLIQDQPAGAMLAVALGQAQIAPYLGAGLSLAAVNSPSTCVVAGAPEAIAALHKRLTAAGVSARQVETGHAFHSPLLAPAAPELAALLASVPLRPPQIPYISNLTGTWITAEQATDPHYWARHLCQPVRFADGVAALLAQPDLVLVELGPGQNLGSFVRQHPGCTRERMGEVLGALRGRNEVQGDLPTLLTALGRLWLLDVPVDWAGFVADERRRRVPLPTYPFERQRYWLAAQPRRNAAGIGSPERRPDPGDWFCVPSWKRTSLPAETGAAETGEPARWLVFTDSCGVGEHVASRLAEQGHLVVRVAPGAAFRRTGPDRFSLRPGQAEEYQALLRELAREGRLPGQIAHCWMVTPPRPPAEEDPSALLDDGFHSLIGLAQALGNQDVGRCRIQIVSSNMQDVSGSEPVDPLKATLLGPAKVIPQEYRAIACRSIDIELLPGGTPAPRLLDNLLAELTCADSTATLALRGPHRWVQAYEPVSLPPAEPHPRLRQGGVYLITGGLGGIGLALAEHLAETLGARLALLGRSGLPPEEQWDAILAEQDPEGGVARQIRLVRQLRARTPVLLLQADVADEAQVSRAVAQTVERFGALHGVLHAAGVPGVGLIQLKNRAAAEAVLAPKVQGTLALSRALRDIPLDLLVLFSSVASATGGGPGQVDYCAANAFLESYARCNPLPHGQTVAVGWGEWRWDAWQDGLQGYPAAAREYLAASRRAYGLSFAEGAEALRRVLASRLSAVYVTTQDLPTLVAHSQGALLDSLLGRSPDQDQERTRYPRPALGSSYVEPRNPTEAALVGIWSAVLGIEQVGIHDSFFELGGNSLVGVELVARIRRALALESLPNHVLYEAPSVAALAACIANQGQPAPDEEDNEDDRGERRRTQLGRLNRRPQVEEEDLA